MVAPKLMNKLKLQDILPIKISTVYKEVGNYTCVNLSLYKDVWHIAPYYWRLVDGKISLLEIGIDPATGQFLSLNVVLYNNFIKRKILDNEQQRSPNEVTGIPTFSTEIWGMTKLENFRERFYDVHNKFQLAMIGKNLEVVLFNEEISYQIDFLQQINFGFNSSKELCVVTVNDLSDLEITSLKNYEKLHTANIPAS